MAKSGCDRRLATNYGWGHVQWSVRR